MVDPNLPYFGWSEPKRVPWLIQSQFYISCFQQKWLFHYVFGDRNDTEFL